MADKQTYVFEVETIKSGQPRKYADEEYEFIVTNKCETEYSPHVIERFCKGFLRPPIRFKDSPCWADSVESFEKIDNRTFRYKQRVPFTD